MNSEPLVSIITPAFNAEATVAQTIESVIAQTYTNWELLVVDDASSDATAEIVADYTTRDRRIRLIRLEKNTGTPGRAKNAALPMATGEYLAFLDADDLWLPEKLALQVAQICISGADLCYTGGWYVDEVLAPRGAFSPRFSEGSMFDRLLAQYEINNHTVMLKRSALLALVEPRFNPDIVIGEDCDLFMRIARTGKLLSLPDRLVWYRVRSDSISMTRIEHSHEGLAEVIRWTCADPVLADRCSQSLRFARAKLGFYQAKTAMVRGDRAAALAAMRPIMFVGWKYTILALATCMPPLWRFCLRFGTR